LPHHQYPFPGFTAFRPVFARTFFGNAGIRLVGSVPVAGFIPAKAFGLLIVAT
jgi:hypothetical protein